MSDKQDDSKEEGVQSDKYLNEYLMMQLKQQELIRAQEEIRIAREEERERKKKEFEHKMYEYNLKCRQIPIIELKKWAGSGIVLIMAILSTITLVSSIGSFIVNFSLGIYGIISGLIQLLLASLVCAGFWRSYAMGKSKDMTVNSGGARILRGVFTFYKVILYIAMVLVVLGVLLMIITLKACTDVLGQAVVGTDTWATPSYGYLDEDEVLIGLVFGVIAVFALLIVYCSYVSRFANDVVMSLTTQTVKRSKTTVVAVMFFIIGGFALIGSFSVFASMDSLSEYLKSLGVGGEAVAEIIMSSTWLSIVLQIVNSAIYLLGGILALQFGSLSQKVEARISAIEKPVE